jgi:GT2 family glycosyltransferase
MHRFTVLLPTHNRADVIGFSIRSILAQTEQDFELFVVGDGCTDATADVVARFEDRRIRWFDFEKAPFSGYANRNIALRQASGELIAYAQHDDLMLPDHLALLGSAMRSEIDWAYSRPLWVTTDGIAVPSGTNLTIPDELAHFLDVRNTIPSNCVVHRRDCLERFGYWPESHAHVADWLLWRTMIRSVGVGRIAYVPTATSLHFSALWKDSRHGGVPEVATWLRLIEESGWWPSALQRPVTEPRHEQRIWFEALRDGGEEFVAELRAAIPLVMDRQGWDNILHTLPRVDVLETALAERDAALGAATARAISLEAQLQDMLAQHEAASTKAASFEARLQDMRAQHEAANAKAASFEAQLQDARGRLNETERALSDIDVILQQTTQDLLESQAAASRLQRHLDVILASQSWRVTAPARRLRGFLRNRFGRT